MLFSLPLVSTKKIIWVIGGGKYSSQPMQAINIGFSHLHGQFFVFKFYSRMGHSDLVGC